MGRRVSALLVAFAAALPLRALAQETVQTCPSTSSPLNQAQLVFSADVPQAIGMCLYNDAMPRPLTLQGRCSIAPVDTYLDAGRSGGSFSAGIHICEARSDPLRCKFTCRPF